MFSLSVVNIKICIYQQRGGGAEGGAFVAGKLLQEGHCWQYIDGIWFSHLKPLCSFKCIYMKRLCGPLLALV